MQTLLKMKTGMHMSSHMVLAVQLLRAPDDDLERIVAREISENPALERVERAQLNRSFRGNGTIHAGQIVDEGLPSQPSALDQLISQASLIVVDQDLESVIALLQSLDEYGYLRTPIAELARRLSRDETDLERLIGILHQLEPPGIGARDLHECLLLQCESLATSDYPDHAEARLTLQILRDAWPDFSTQQFQRVVHKLKLPAPSVKKAWHFMVNNLYPSPMQMIRDGAQSFPAYHRPDLLVNRSVLTGKPVYTLEIPAAQRYELQISDSFAALMHDAPTSAQLTEREQRFLHEHLEKARQFVACLDQRWETLRRIGEFLIKFQLDYFENGPVGLKPLTQSRVAAELGCHESTVSRAVSGKILQTPTGRLIPLEMLFDAALPVKQAIRNLLATQPGPLSDREIAEHLNKQGWPVARRTVAKYRSQVIPIRPSYVAGSRGGNQDY